MFKFLLVTEKPLINVADGALVSKRARVKMKNGRFCCKQSADKVLHHGRIVGIMYIANDVHVVHVVDDVVDVV